MGISVKGRTRKPGTENEGVNINNGDFEKVQRACKAFGCTPYFAIVRDAAVGREIVFYILSMDKMLSLYSKGKSVLNWRMTPQAIESYKRDSEIKVVEFFYNTHSWW